MPSLLRPIPATIHATIPPKESAHAVEVNQHYEKQYACGCTTTRIETIFLPTRHQEYCTAHNSPLQKTSLILEYAPAPDPPP